MPLTSEKELVSKWEKDREVMKNKQVCVGFGPQIASFPILVPGRFLLHEGEVNTVEKRRRKKVSIDSGGFLEIWAI